MTAQANTARPQPLVRDRVENYRGNQLLYVGWDHHTMICAPVALLVSPDLTFGELLDTLLAETAFAQHPEWEKIDWSKAQWLHNDAAFSPDRDASLKAQGLKHKAYLRFVTPGLTGIANTGS